MVRILKSGRTDPIATFREAWIGGSNYGVGGLFTSLIGGGVLCCIRFGSDFGHETVFLWGWKPNSPLSPVKK